MAHICKDEDPIVEVSEEGAKIEGNEPSKEEKESPVDDLPERPIKK